MDKVRDEFPFFFFAAGHFTAKINPAKNGFGIYVVLGRMIFMLCSFILPLDGSNA